MEDASKWISGADFNAQGAAGGANPMTQAVSSVANMAIAIFGAVGANKYVTSSRFKPDDVVIVETARDSRAYIALGASIVLLIVVLILIYVRSK